MSIREALSRYSTLTNHKGDVGIEIETETLEPYKAPTFSLWDHHVDDSLRDYGIEYTLKRPMIYGKELQDSLLEFKTKTKDIPFKKSSFTTSVHVHLNVLKDSFLTLGNFFSIYLLIENLLVRYAGENRLSNLFCLPVCDAEETFTNIMQLAREIERKRYGAFLFDAGRTKYAALNLSALPRFGSLEIRLLEGSTDIDKISEWVDILYGILSYSRTKGLTPHQILKMWRDKGPKILDSIFNEKLRKAISHKNEEELLEENSWYMSSVACAVKDWAAMEIQVKGKKLTSKDMDQWANKYYFKKFDDPSEFEKRILLQTMKDNNFIVPNEFNPGVPIPDEVKAAEEVTLDRFTQGINRLRTGNVTTNARNNWDDFPPIVEDE